jgi:hypothetical protein
MAESSLALPFLFFREVATAVTSGFFDHGLNTKGVSRLADPFIFMVPKPGFEPGQAYTH